MRNMDKTFKIKSDWSSISIGYKDGMRFYKGETEIIIDISPAHTTNNPIIKMKIDFNDDSEVIIKYYDFSSPDKIAELIKHTFKPIVGYDYQNIVYFPTVFMEFLNGDEFIYQCPVKILKSSFYTDYVNINVGNAQFIDESTNSLFCTLDTAKGDILNIKIK